jgi:hypothetical protein
MNPNDPALNINSRSDLETLRDTYYKLGGCKLIHRRQLPNKFFDDSGAIKFAKYWLDDDDPHLVHQFKDANENLNEWEMTKAGGVYTFAKFLWLWADLQHNETHIPPQAHYIRNLQMEDELVCHPGSVKVTVLDYYNKDFELLIWNSKDKHPDVETLTFEDWCDIVPVQGTQIMRTPGTLEVWTDTGFHNDIETWYRDFHSKVKNKFTVFIGHDNNHSYASDKCARSIHKYNPNIDIKFIDISQLPMYNREWEKQTTEFTYSRFLVPHLMNYEGVAIFCDDDFIWNCDPLEVLYSFDVDKAVSVVQHNFNKDLSGTKLDDQKNVMYPKKLWSSLMLFNCGHPDCANLTPHIVNTKSGQWLHQFYWTNNIGKIPHTYNWCEGSCDYCSEASETIDEAKVTHFTRGGPWLPGDWSHINALEKWHKVP